MINHYRLIDLNNKSKNLISSPIFFGSKLGLQRYDIIKYPQVNKLIDRQISYFWLPEEVKIEKDKNDFNLLSETEQFIFTNNLKYQTLLDTIQTRGIPLIKNYVSNNEIESFCIVWEFFEHIHSRAYSYIIRNLYSDPSYIFDNLNYTDSIFSRAKSTIESYENLANTTSPTFDDILILLVNINILEGVRFYVSFACSFYFTEFKKLMEGNSKIISLVVRDEILHLQFTQFLINTLKSEFPEFKESFDKNKNLFIDMFNQTLKEEIEWAEYLFSDYDKKILDSVIKYMKYLVCKRMKAINLPSIYKHNYNPMKWIDKFFNSKNLQVAPQETEITSYLINGLQKDEYESILNNYK